MKLRRFNNSGIEAFTEYRSRLVIEPLLPPPFEHLEDDTFCDALPEEVEVNADTCFENRLHAGKYMHSLVSAAKIDLPEYDKGLWTWLTLCFFDQVCPPDTHGHRKPMAEERLIAKVDSHQKFYRHLLLGPYLIVRAHLADPNRAMAMLCTPVCKPGEIVAQLASRKELVTNPAVAELATQLYYSTETGTFKKGAGSDVKGAPRRLADLLNQLDLTYYLYGMTTAEIQHLLPKEFDRFRS